MARRSRPLLALVLLMSWFVAPIAPAVRAQIDPDLRDSAVAAAVQVAIAAEWREAGRSMLMPLPLGSGTLVSSDGLILTNAHVVDADGIAAQVDDIESFIQEDDPAGEVVYQPNRLLVLGSDGVRPPEPAFLAEVVQIEPNLDLAVLRLVARPDGTNLPNGFEVPFVPLGDSDALGLGDPLHIFGYPASGGDALTYTTGVVSGFNFDDDVDGPAWINTDAVISGGSSGGTAVDARGELVGIPTQGSRLDCRPGDTDGDGDVTPEDIGCIPTGGSIGQLRPVNLAKPMLEAAEQRDATTIRTEPRPTPTPTPVPAPALDSGFGMGDDFSVPYPENEIMDESAAREYDDGALVMSVFRPGVANSLNLGDWPSDGRDIGWRVDVAATEGAGEVILRLESLTDGSDWLFSLDPANQTWSLYRLSQADSFFVWVEPRPAPISTGSPLDLEVRVVGGVPSLLIGGTDVVQASGISMPNLGNDVIVGFGVGIDPNGPNAWSTSFSASFDRIALYELP